MSLTKTITFNIIKNRNKTEHFGNHFSLVTGGNFEVMKSLGEMLDMEVVDAIFEKLDIVT